MTTERKLAALAALAEGMGQAEAAEAAAVHRTTLWRWATDDPEFIATRAKIADAAVTAMVAELRSLAPQIVQALRRGLASEDDSLAVRTADLAAKRIAEFNPRSEVELSASEQLADLIRRLDDDGDSSEPDAPSGPPGEAPG